MQQLVRRPSASGYQTSEKPVKIHISNIAHLRGTSGQEVPSRVRFLKVKVQGRSGRAQLQKVRLLHPAQCTCIMSTHAATARALAQWHEVRELLRACVNVCFVAWTAARICTLCVRAMRSVVQKRTYVNDAYDWVPSPYVRRQKKTSAARTCMLANVRASTLARKCLCSCMSVTARRAASVLHIVQALHARLATRTWRTSRPTSPRRACARLSPRLR